MQLYDTLSNAKKFLKPRSGNKIEIFVCGPTVYDYSHIGHARTYIAFDAFVKYLRLKGYEVRYLQNITDIDDKIIARAKETNRNVKQLAESFADAYYEDMKALGIDSVDIYARATDYIPEIISQVERLLDNGYAYQIPHDGVYYDISTFGDYGKLSRRTIEQAEDAVSRIDESTKKRNKGDFALWKLSNKGAPTRKPQSEPKWPSPWGDGRPGWHIEDTAITEKYFGSQYDIHGGARDLVFPHHEAEIAQIEAISGKKPLVHYWLHSGFLTIGGVKMSKSLGNFITIRDLLHNHSKEAFRLFVFSSHYRSPINYTENAVRQAEANARRLGEFMQRVEGCLPSTPRTTKGDSPNTFTVKKFVSQFERELEDDFNTPNALAVVFDLIREGNTLLDQQRVGPEDCVDILEFLNRLNRIFGIIPEMMSLQIPAKVRELVEQREQLRIAKKWKESDNVRAEVEKMGYRIEDLPSGPQIKKA